MREVNSNVRGIKMFEPFDSVILLLKINSKNEKWSVDTYVNHGVIFNSEKI